MIILGIDPGFASGGFSRLIDGKFDLLESLPRTRAPLIDDRVDSAVAWFCERILVADLVCIENQHGTAHGQSRDRQSNANVTWVREVVGGIRRGCYVRRVPVRLVEPQEWRTRLGLARSAPKTQAWLAVCAMHPELTKTKNNEHSRDAAVIAKVGSIAAHLWLIAWRETHGRNAA